MFCRMCSVVYVLSYCTNLATKLVLVELGWFGCICTQLTHPKIAVIGNRLVWMKWLHVDRFGQNRRALSLSPFPKGPANREKSNYTKRDTNSCAYWHVVGIIACYTWTISGGAGIIRHCRRSIVGPLHQVRQSRNTRDGGTTSNRKRCLWRIFDVTAYQVPGCCISEQGITTILSLWAGGIQWDNSRARTLLSILY